MTLVCATLAAVAGCASGPAKPPTSEEIKASAQAALDHSLNDGREARQNLVAAGRTPSDGLCQAAWDNKLATEQQSLLYAEWMTGCADKPAQ